MEKNKGDEKDTHISMLEIFLLNSLLIQNL